MSETMNRYVALAHAIQSGVAMDLQHDPAPGTPKHLRTGLDCRAADHGALARLLIAKGVFTLEEYEAAILEGLEREKASYEQRLTERFGGGTKINLA